MKAIARINTGDELQDRWQAEVVSKLNPALKCALLGGHLVTAAVTSSGTTPVAHKLARKPLGYFIVGSDSNVNVWGPTTSKVLSLSASANANITLWVF